MRSVVSNDSLNLHSRRIHQLNFLTFSASTYVFKSPVFWLNQCEMSLRIYFHSWASLKVAYIPCHGQNRRSEVSAFVLVYQICQVIHFAEERNPAVRAVVVQRHLSNRLRLYFQSYFLPHWACSTSSGLLALRPFWTAENCCFVVALINCSFYVLECW